MTEEAQYWISQGGKVQGPFARSKVLGYIEAGRVRRDMQFSLDGGDWVEGAACPDLFPPQSSPPPLPATPAARRPSAPAPTRRAAQAPPASSRAGGSPRRTRGGERPRRGPPSGFLMAAVCDFLFAALAVLGGGYLAWVSSAAIEALTTTPAGIIEGFTNPEAESLLQGYVVLGWAFVLAGVAAGAMGLFVRAGTPQGRTAQIGVSLGCIAITIWGLAVGWVSFITVGGIAAQGAALVLMLQQRPARDAALRRRRR